MQTVEKIIGYEFTNTELREEALLAAGASISDPAIDGDPRGNKRLALVGDAVLQLLILEKWYGQGTDTGKQPLARILTSLIIISGRIRDAQGISLQRCAPDSSI